MNKAFRLLFVAAMAIVAPAILAETVKDREAAVRGDRAAIEKDTHWIYNDVERGFAEAKRTGKPLLVVLRCVPCLACAGIDAQVLLQETDLAPLLDQFVCVRLINANALNLSLFQFDYDLSFSTLFFNGDGTVYGRYGSWVHQKDAQDKTTAGYKRALEAALTIHRGYPGNKTTLVGKQGAEMPFKTPLEIPELAGKYQRNLDWEGKVVQSCVHCHQVSDALRVFYREQKKTLPAQWIYPCPEPETIGLVLATDHIARVESVVDGSPGANAGLRPGDDVVSLAGQPLVSIADVSWILHSAPESGPLRATVKRGGEEKSLTIVLPNEWRKKADISHRVGTWTMRAMATGGLLLEDLTDEERGRRQLGNREMALLVKHAGEYGKHAAAKNAGFRKDDVIVRIEGVPDRVTESQLIGDLLQKHQPGEQVKATVLRGERRIDLSLPIQ